MNAKGAKNLRTIFFAFAILFFLLVVFLFSGTAVNKYYHIRTPASDKIIEVIPGFSKNAFDAESIKLLNWNVYKGKNPGCPADFRFLSQGMDIILVQEICQKNKDRDGFSVTGMGGMFARSFSYRKKRRIQTGVMTLSTVRPISAAVIQSRFREPVTHTPKVSLLTDYPLKKNKKKLLVVNTHGINFVTSAAFESQMINLEKKIKEHQGPVIFAGDFNAWNKKRRIILKKIINRLGMKEAGFYSDTRSKWFGYFLDHVFYKGLKIKQTKVFEDITSSDHKAIAIEFFLPAIL